MQRCIGRSVALDKFFPHLEDMFHSHERGPE